MPHLAGVALMLQRSAIGFLAAALVFAVAGCAVTYTLAGTAETPTFTPDAGTGPFDAEVRVTMSTGTTGAGVWYTTDGSDPRPADG